MSDEDSALSFAYAGWAQCALPIGELLPEKSGRWFTTKCAWWWNLDAGRLVRIIKGPMEIVGVPFGAYPRLILLYLQTQALRTNSREVELGNSWRDWMSRIGCLMGRKQRPLRSENKPSC